MNMEQLQEAFKQLQAQCKQSEDHVRKLEETRASESAAASIVYHTKPEKTLKKFREGDDVTDWIETAKRHINRLKDESEKVDMVLNFLDKKPLLEVKFRICREKATAEEVFKVLQEVFGLKDTSHSLEKKFYSRNQEPNESIQDYSLALMEILMDMEKLGSTVRSNSDSRLKERFADGVHDVALRRELNRLNKERKSLKFFELREEAIDWCRKDDDSSRGVTTLEESSAEATHQHSQLMQVLQEQQSQIHQISQSMNNNFSRGRGSYRGRGRGRGQHGWNSWRSQSGTRNDNPPTTSTFQGSQQPSPAGSESAPADGATSQDDIVCRYCNGLHHVERNCIKRKRDRRQQTGTYEHPSNFQQTTNYHQMNTHPQSSNYQQSGNYQQFRDHQVHQPSVNTQSSGNGPHSK